ncbi:MAG: S8 family serine peptidase [Thermoanaerobaculia bacterium]
MRAKCVRLFPLLGVLVARLASGSAADERSLISLNSRIIDPSTALAELLPPALRAEPGERGSEYQLVKFSGPVNATQLQALTAASERVYTYLPHDTFLVRVRQDGREAPRLAATGATWIGTYHPAYKLSRFVSEVSARDTASDAKSRKRIVMLQIYPDADLTAVLAEIQARGAEGVVGARPNGFFSRIRLLLAPEEIVRLRDSLAEIPEVFWIDVEGRRVLLNDTTVWVGQSGLAGGQTTPVFDQGLHGEGQVVAVLDTGIDPDMCYFRDTARGLPPRNECNGGTVIDALQRKVLAVDFLWSSECSGGITSSEWDTQGHGTHVAGTVAGDNFANLIARNPGDGMAPAAKLVVQDCGYQVNACADCPGIGCPVVDLNPIFQQTYSQGARIHSNSWGDQEDASPQNNYTTGSQDVDEFMWNHKDFLIFFAAGNSGPGTASVGSPSTAKSAISVGATLRGTSANSMASFSSCGPTDDGRFKPEITVPGSSIVSAANDGSVTTNNCGTTSMSGTSMATPGAAGLTALVRQYFVDGFYPTGAAIPGNGFTPSAALLRSTLVNSGETMSGAGAIPGNCQGWGRVLLDNALQFGNENRRLWVRDDNGGFASGSTNEDRTFTFTVAAGQPFKATLAWTDFPSTPAANPHLNNDLDLVVTGPGGTYRGNAFASGQSTTGGSADRRNTLEQVLLLNPAAGTYTVTVRSFSVPSGPQPFALTVTGAVSEGGTCTPPAAPTGVSATTSAQTTASVSWSASSGTTSYSVSRSATSGGPYTAVGSSATSPFSNTGLTCNTTYYYVVSASNGSCSSGNSAQASVTTAACTGGGTTLTNGVPVTGISGALNSQQSWTMAVPAGASLLKFQTSGGTGDADMYVRFGAAPTLTTYDCRPYVNGNAETCNIATAQVGTYYVMLNGYTAYSGLTLVGSYTTGGGGCSVVSESEANDATTSADPLVAPCSTVNGTFVGGTDSNDYFSMTVPAGATVTGLLNGLSVDYDLYLYRAGSTTAVASSTNGGSTADQATWTNSTGASTTVYARVYKYSATRTTYTVKVSY